MNKRIFKSRVILLIAFVLLTLLSVMYIRHIWNTNAQENADQALKTAEIAGEAFSKDDLSKLNTSLADLNKKEYQYIKNGLVNIAKIEKDIRFAYIYVKKGDKLYFVADSEPADSADYSPPGQEYYEAADQYYQPFIDGKDLITDPSTDRWGKWVSILIPIKDSTTGKIIAVFAVDHPAGEWNKEAFQNTLQSGVIALLLFLLSVTVLITINSSLKVRDDARNFRAFFEEVDDIVVVSAKGGEIIYVNGATSRKLGYSKKELLQMHVLGLNPKNKRKEAAQILNDMYEGKRTSSSLPFEKEDGTLLSVETRVWFSKWSGIDCIFGISKDLTSEQEATQKFNKTFENNPALMAISSLPKQKFTDVNKIFIKKLGYTKEELIGKSAKDLNLFVEPEKQKLLSKELKEKGFIHDVELKVRTKSGGILEGIFSGEVIESKGKKLFLTVMIDQTERIKEEEKLQNIISGTNAGTWEWNVQTGETTFNERWAEIIGYTLDELKPISIKTWEKYSHPEDFAKSEELLKAHFKGETKTYSFDSRMKHKNGSWVWVYDSGSVTEWDKEGKPLRMFGTHIDITNIKLAGEEIAKKNSELEKLNKFMTGRELRIIALKKEIARLKELAGE